jgi:hypothetical protein
VTAVDHCAMVLAPEVRVRANCHAVRLGLLTLERQMLLVLAEAMLDPLPRPCPSARAAIRRRMERWGLSSSWGPSRQQQ